MKLLFTTVPAFGHLHPLMPLALAATAAGDDVLVATGADFADWVSSCGVAYAQAGRVSSRSWSSAEYELLKTWGDMRNLHLFTTFRTPPMTRDLLSLCRDWAPDIIVHEETEYAAPLVAGLLGLPCVTHSYSAPARPPHERAMMIDLLAPVWREFTTEAPRVSGDTYLDACPPAFQTDAVKSIPNVRTVRPVSFDGPHSESPPWLGTLPRPAAYVTFGTVALFSRIKVIQETIDAVAPTVKGLVVTTGPNPADALNVRQGTVVDQYLRQSLILGSVDVVVSHGGAGTTLGAIENGLPHVVIPQQAMSQLRNAERIEALGIGLHIPQGAHADAGRAVQRVLDEPLYTQNTVAMRVTLDELPAPEEVLADLHRLRT